MDQVTPTAAAEPPKDPAAPLGGDIPMPQDGPCGVSWWLAQIQTAKDKRDLIAREHGWKDRIASYLGKPLTSAPLADTVIVPKDYANTEQKKAQLCTQVPEIHLEPKQDAFAVAAPIAQAVLRDYLAPNHVNALAVMDEVLFDALCPAGLMCSKIGYEAVQDGVKPVPTGAVDAFGQPVLADAPNIVFERYFWERFSPLKVLIPSDFHGSNYHKAPWLGFEFDFDPSDQTGLNPKETIADLGKAKDKPTGVEIWYRPAACGDATEKHPEKFRCLVFKDGQVVKHVASPYQKVSPDGQILGMRRNPIHIGALRYVSDSAYPPSDCQMSAPQVEELSAGRSQMVRQRKRSQPMRWADRNRVDKDILDKLVSGAQQEIILTDGNGDEIIGEVARAEYPRENFEFDRTANRDMAETWALSLTPGAENETTKTATEASLFNSKSDIRLRKERHVVLSYFLAAAESILALVQLFADDTDYVRIVGPDGVAKLQTWDKQTIAGDFAFTAKPDSAVFQDQALQRKHATEVYQFLAPNKQVNQQELTRWYLQQQDMEPAKFVAPPPQPEPEKPKVTYSFTGEDLNPLAPQFSIVAFILQASGMQLPPQVVQEAQQVALLHAATGTAAPHTGVLPAAAQGAPALQSGTAPMQSPLNKHKSEETGRLPGGGSATAGVN